MSKIECIAYKPNASGALQGFADFKVPKWGVELYGCGVFMKEGRRWISLPSRKYEDNGEVKYAQIMRFTEKEHATAFSKLLLDELDAYAAKQAMEPSGETFAEGEGLPF